MTQKKSKTNTSVQLPKWAEDSLKTLMVGQSDIAGNQMTPGALTNAAAMQQIFGTPLMEFQQALKNKYYPPGTSAVNAPGGAGSNAPSNAAIGDFYNKYGAS